MANDQEVDARLVSRKSPKEIKNEICEEKIKTKH